MHNNGYHGVRCYGNMHIVPDHMQRYVGASYGDVRAVAANLANINTVANNIDDVTEVADNIDDVVDEVVDDAQSGVDL